MPLTDLPAEAQEEAATQIAATLRGILGEADALDPDVWELIARERGCDIDAYYLPNGPRGQYMPGTTEGTGVIRYNIAYPLDMQARIICHEIAHHELHIWIPPRLRNGADLHCYDGDVSDVQHYIARRVEDLVFGSG